MDYLKDINFRIQSTLARYPRSLESLKKLWTEARIGRELEIKLEREDATDPDLALFATEIYLRDWRENLRLAGIGEFESPVPLEISMGEKSI